VALKKSSPPEKGKKDFRSFAEADSTARGARRFARLKSIQNIVDGVRFSAETGALLTTFG